MLTLLMLTPLKSSKKFGAGNEAAIAPGLDAAGIAMPRGQGSWVADAGLSAP
jgi:hypothetical protein